MVFVFLSVLPNFFKSIVKDVFVVRVMDLGIIGTFMILTYVSIENNVKIKNLERKIEKMIRKISLEKIKRID